MSTMVPSNMHSIGAAAGVSLPPHPTITMTSDFGVQQMRHDPGEEVNSMFSARAEPPFFSEYPGVTGSKARLYGGRLFTDSTLFEDVGTPSHKANRQRMIQRGMPILVLGLLDKKRINEYSEYDMPAIADRVKEFALFDQFEDDASLGNYYSVNIRISADLNFFEPGETDGVFAIATSKTMEPVVTNAYEKTKTTVDKCVPGMWNIIKHLYTRVGYGHMVANTFDKLYVFCVYDSSNQLYWIPLVNPTVDDILAIKHRLTMNAQGSNEKRCLTKVYYVGQLMEPYTYGEHGWIVSLQCVQF